MSIYIPPGGMAGWSQMTPASKAAQAGGRVGRRSKRRGTKRTAKRSKRANGTKKRARSSGRKLKFGSPAWRKKYLKK